MKDLKIPLQGKKPPQIWFTADLHLGHANVIKYTKRPFADVDEMDTRIIANWNSYVQPNDIVFCLGDVALTRGASKRADMEKYLRRLAGHKYLVFGNHDAKNLAAHEDLCAQFFEGFWDLKDIQVQDADAESGWQRITLCHYKLETWNKSHYGAWHLFGHSHGSFPWSPHHRSMDVGVDNIAKFYGTVLEEGRPDWWLGSYVTDLRPENYRPVSYKEVKNIMSKIEFKPVDHHDGARDE